MKVDKEFTSLRSVELSKGDGPVIYFEIETTSIREEIRFLRMCKNNKLRSIIIIFFYFLLPCQKVMNKTVKSTNHENSIV